MKKVDQKLNFLSKVYYVFGALYILPAFIAPVVIYYDLRIQPPPFPVPIVLTGIAVLTVLASLAMFLCLLLAGRSIVRRERYQFVFIVSVVLCLSVPIGTAIGVFAFMVLNDPKTKQQFEGKLECQKVGAVRGKRPPDLPVENS